MKKFGKVLHVGENFDGTDSHWYNKKNKLGNLLRFEKAKDCYDKATSLDSKFKIYSSLMSLELERLQKSTKFQKSDVLIIEKSLEMTHLLMELLKQVGNEYPKSERKLPRQSKN